MYLHAYDLSLECTGVTIFDLKTKEPVYVGTIPTNSSYTDAKRLFTIGRELQRLRKEYTPKAVAIESTFLSYQNQKNVLMKAKLDKVHGVCNFLFHDCEQSYYTPSEWKAKLLAGNATKKMIRDAIRNKYPNIAFNEKAKGKDGYDDSDSFGIALCYLIDNKLIQWEKSARETTVKKTTAPKKATTSTKKPTKEAMKSLRRAKK